MLKDVTVFELVFHGQRGLFYIYFFIGLFVKGCLHSGIAITTLNPAYTAHEISRQLLASRATAIVSHRCLLHSF